eukprot:Lithocolla_globosa_v1_NODE_3549_length_1640_cov_113.752681.p1 type:complete len:442 gc:universal NODE_3549_length_1640_cov_113.752681:1471-146(-)
MLSSVSVLSALVGAVAGHGALTVPSPRLDPQGRAASYIQDQPVFNMQGPMTHADITYTSNAMRCRDYSTPTTTVTPLVAGGSVGMEWYLSATHPGDCFVYISHPDDDPANPSQWIKLAQFVGCGDLSNSGLGPNPLASQSHIVSIPSSFPACDHCVLRWEWYSVQQVSNIEFYVQCTDVSVSSSSTSAIPAGDVVTISGIEHLSLDINDYRKAYDGQLGEEYLVGPSLASIVTGGGGDDDDDQVSCSCNGHSSECTTAGVCMNCADNTEGTTCQTCSAGYYGNPTNGNDCYLCACNGHSTSCDSTSGECSNCQGFTTGSNCQFCEFGYEGDATNGGACTAIATSAPDTGDCSTCETLLSACETSLETCQMSSSSSDCLGTQSLLTTCQSTLAESQASYGDLLEELNECQTQVEELENQRSPASIAAITLSTLLLTIGMACF